MAHQHTYKEVVRYFVDDPILGESDDFYSDTSALHYVEDLTRRDRAQELWDNGEDLRKCLNSYSCADTPYDKADYDFLHGFTKRHGISISHWQCKEKPGYRLTRFYARGVYIGGNVGAWTGGYGDTVSTTDALRWIKYTIGKFGLVEVEQQ